MSWKVLITASPIGKVGAAAVARLEAAGCKVVHEPRESSGGEELIRLLEGAEAVIAGGGDRFSAEVLNSTGADRLRIISRWGVGYDAIDIPAATARGIVVAYTPGMTDDAVADYTFALLLALARRIPEGHQSMRQGLWVPQWGNDMAGKTLGILGYGRIGRAVARRAHGFGLRILTHDPTPRPEEKDVTFVSFPQLLAESDYLTLHAALSPKSRGLLGAAQFRLMKPTALLVNAARGPLVDEAGLLAALREGWIAGAALDVFSEEPLPPEHPIRTAPNLLLSPHQASASRETGERVSLAAAQAILDLHDGRRPKMVVNPEVFGS